MYQSCQYLSLYHNSFLNFFLKRVELIPLGFAVLFNVREFIVGADQSLVYAILR